MPSPSPGMDPFIEGQVWRGFHDSLIIELQATLVPDLRPHYVALVGERVYVERAGEDAPGYIGPDVAVARDLPLREPAGEGGVAVLTAPVAVPLAMPERVEEIFLEIYLRASQDLVTVIEVLSPSNKRLGSDGRREYLAKRDAILQSSVHLLELDLLRGEERLPMARPLPPAEYYAILSRARRRPMGEVWPIRLRDRLPVVPVPLAGKDPDVLVDLQEVFTRVYDRAGYDYTLDYDREPQPPLSEADAAWAKALLASWRSGGTADQGT